MTTQSGDRHNRTPQVRGKMAGWMWMLVASPQLVMGQELGAPPGTGYPSRFVCPESLPTEEARLEAARQFAVWAQGAHPDWDLNRFVDYRMALLTEHHCDETLANIAANGEAVNQQKEERLKMQLLAWAVGGCLVVGWLVQRRRASR